MRGEEDSERKIHTAVGDIAELASTLELDEVLQDRGLDELTVKLGMNSHQGVLRSDELRTLTSATPLTLRLPMQARYAMRTCLGKPSVTWMSYALQTSMIVLTLNKRHAGQPVPVAREPLLDSLQEVHVLSRESATSPSHITQTD